MKIGLKETQEIIAIIGEHGSAIEEFFADSARDEHREFTEGLGFDVSMIVDFCKALAVIGGGVKGIRMLVDAAVALFKWASPARPKTSAVSAPEAAGLRERVLVLVFEAHVNRREGLSLERLAYVTGAEPDAVNGALEMLLASKVVRRTRAGTWRYVVQGT